MALGITFFRRRHQGVDTGHHLELPLKFISNRMANRSSISEKEVFGYQQANTVNQKSPPKFFHSLLSLTLKTRKG